MGAVVLGLVAMSLVIFIGFQFLPKEPSFPYEINLPRDLRSALLARHIRTDEDEARAQEFEEWLSDNNIWYKMDFDRKTIKFRYDKQAVLFKMRWC